MTSNANTGFPDSPLEGYEPTGDRVVFAEIDSTTVTTTNGITHGKFATSGGGGGPVTVADGADVAQGTTTQTKATDGSATSWSVIQLLKGIFDKLLNTIGVTQSGTWTVQPGNTANTTAWKVDNSAVTQPVSASSLPLPSGASTAAKQPALGTAGTPSADVISVQGVASGTPQPTSAASGQFVDGSIATIGAKADTAITDSTTTNSLQSFIKGFVKVLADVWDSTNHLLHFNLKQVGGNAIATGNNAVPVLNAASAGAVAAYGSNAAALTANTDYQFKWGGGGTTQVNHVMLQNNSGSSVSWDDSAATTAGSVTLATGQTLFLDVQTANFHLQATGTPNVGGSSSNNIVVKGWL